LANCLKGGYNHIKHINTVPHDVKFSQRNNSIKNLISVLCISFVDSEMSPHKQIMVHNTYGHLKGMYSGGMLIQNIFFGESMAMSL
jgi:hypothetical protein